MRYGSGSEDQDWKIAEIGVLKIVDWKLQFCTISGVINSSGIWKTLSSQEKDFMGKAIIGCYEDQFKLDETGKKLRKTVRMLLSDQDSIRILALACLHATLALENSLENSSSCSSPDSQKSSASTTIGVTKEEICTIMDARTNFRLEEGKFIFFDVILLIQSSALAMLLHLLDCFCNTKHTFSFLSRSKIFGFDFFQ
jgi:hypothetical protein